jgi:hypothetical protein
LWFQVTEQLKAMQSENAELKAKLTEAEKGLAQKSKEADDAKVEYILA